jgi:hypothetical protein
MAARAEHAGDLVTFLNAWACRLDRTKAPGLFHDWIATQADALEALAPVTLTDPRVPQLAAGVEALYDSLIALRGAGLRNMGDAAASKALHQLLPELVVMWDKAIRQAATAQGLQTYGAFLVAMHRLSVRLPADAGARLGSAPRMSLAKRLDEANSYWVGGPTARRPAPPPSRRPATAGTGSARPARGS